MKLLHQIELQFRVARSYDKFHNMSICYVSEYATFYMVTIHIMGYALPSVLDWRISKKDARSSKEAIFSCANEALRNGNL